MEALYSPVRSPWSHAGTGQAREDQQVEGSEEHELGRARLVHLLDLLLEEAAYGFECYAQQSRGQPEPVEDRGLPIAFLRQLPGTRLTSSSPKEMRMA